MNEVIKAIKAIRPGYRFSFSKDEAGNQRLEASYLDWLDNDPETKPSEEEILAEQQKQIDEQYKQLRASEYPALCEFADAIYWSKKGDDTKLEEYLSKCESIKLKYPKG